MNMVLLNRFNDERKMEEQRKNMKHQTNLNERHSGMSLSGIQCLCGNFKTWIPARAHFARLAGMTVVVGMTILLLTQIGCERKDRLGASTFTFVVTPPASSVVLNDTQTFTINSSVSAPAVWSVTPSNVGSLNTNVGSAVIFTGEEYGDATITVVMGGATTISQVTVVSSFSPGGSNQFDVYTDAGLPSGDNYQGDIFKSGINPFEGDASTGYTIEGEKFQRTEGVNGNGHWGVTVDKNGVNASVDLLGYTGGNLVFWIRLNRVISAIEDIRVRIEDLGGPSPNVDITTFGGLNKASTDWQEISVSVSNFTGMSLNQVKVPFIIDVFNISAITDLTFDVDAVRWEK